MAEMCFEMRATATTTVKTAARATTIAIIIVAEEMNVSQRAELCIIEFILWLFAAAGLPAQMYANCGNGPKSEHTHTIRDHRVSMGLLVMVTNIYANLRCM